MSATRSPQLVPVTLQGGVGSRCQPARAVVRAVTATKHEPGLSPLHRVVSYGSAMEVWDLLMRLSHNQRARSEAFAGVPLQRAAVDPLTLSGDKRGRSKALCFAVLNGTSMPDPEPVNFT